MAFDDTIDNSTRPPTDWDSKDLAAAVFKGSLSNIPIVGGAAGEVFGLVLAPQLARRRDNWLESVALRLLELQGKVSDFTVEHLVEDELFVSTVLQASAAALKTHGQTKLNALRNAVLNTALNGSINEAEQQMFMGWIDQFTDWHLAVLGLFCDPHGWARRRGVTYPSWGLGGRFLVLEHAFPQLSGRREFYDQLVRDLHMRGLMTTDSLHMTVSDGSLLQPLATDVGRRFVAYISEPTVPTASTR